MKKTVNFLIKMETYFLLICVFTTLISCQGKKNTDNLTMGQDSIYQLNLSKMETEKIKQYVKNAEEIGEDYSITEEEINLSLPCLKKGLENNGFKFLDNKAFTDRINEVFKINSVADIYSIIRHPLFSTYITLDYNNVVSESDTDEDKLENNKSFEFSESNIIFVNNDNFISMPLSLKEIIIEKEEKLYLNMSNILIHRNKYLFNKDKVSFTWLERNDLNFLDLLVTFWGYDKDPMINKAVLERRFEEYEKYPKLNTNENLFVRKNNVGNLEIRTNLLQYIVDNTQDKQQYEFAKMLYDYTSYIAYSEDFSKEETLKILAYLGYYIQLIYNKFNIISYEDTNWYPGSYLRNELVSNKELLKNIKENNYYSLPDYKSMIETVLNEIEIDSAEYQKNS